MTCTGSGNRPHVSSKGGLYGVGMTGAPSLNNKNIPERKHMSRFDHHHLPDSCWSRKPSFIAAKMGDFNMLTKCIFKSRT